MDDTEWIILDTETTGFSTPIFGDRCTKDEGLGALWSAL
jgi:DNA polymerase III epsilon subunit-like protein